MEVIDDGVEVFGGAVGFFDFESVEGFGVDDAEDFVVSVNNREVGEAGFVETIQSERAEDFGVFDEDHVGFRSHEIFDLAVFKTHDSGDTVAVLVAQDITGGALEDSDEFFESFRSVGRGFGRGLLGTEFVELGIEPSDDFVHYFAKHDIIIIT